MSFQVFWVQLGTAPPLAEVWGQQRPTGHMAAKGKEQRGRSERKAL